MPDQQNQASDIMNREEAITLLAKQAMRTITPQKRTDIIEEWWAFVPELESLPEDLRRQAEEDEDLGDPSQPRYDPLVIEALRSKLGNVSNAYLSDRMRELGYESNIEGIPPELMECFCCFYRTLSRRGEYQICPVCFWEDDGSDDPEHYSSPNHMTLADGRSNVEQYGACSPQHLSHVDPDGRQKYHSIEG